LRVFVDSHVYREVPSDSLMRALKAADRPLPDTERARPLDYLVIPDGHGGRLICIVLAQDAHAVERFHTELGIPLATIKAVDCVDGQSPLSETDRALVLRAIE
jgi:hypothetical protein